MGKATALSLKCLSEIPRWRLVPCRTQQPGTRCFRAYCYSTLGLECTILGLAKWNLGRALAGPSPQIHTTGAPLTCWDAVAAVLGWGTSTVLPRHYGCRSRLRLEEDLQSLIVCSSCRPRDREGTFKDDLERCMWSFVYGVDENGMILERWMRNVYSRLL